MENKRTGEDAPSSITNIVAADAEKVERKQT